MQKLTKKYLYSTYDQDVAGLGWASMSVL
jgi:hypothetical protein